MFSPILFGFSNPNSCLILIFFSFYFHHLPCALSQPDLKFCDNLFHCGNITAGFPFWGEARPEPCGHPSLGLHCHQNSNKTYFIFSGQMYSVLFLDNSTNTLGLARQDFLGVSFCNSTLTGTTLTNELFQLSPEYTTLFVYYLCEPHLTNPANFKCPKIGIASMHRSNENHKKCSASFNITVPTSYAPEMKTLNLSRLQSVLRKGFEVKLMIDGRPCQECKSTGGVCGYDVDTPVCCKRNSPSKIKCNRMIPSVDEHHKKCYSPFTCANQRNLSYPFWIPERKECGHPDFELNCSGDFAEFKRSSVQFQILETKFYNIRLAIKDYQSNLCPRHPENVDINQYVLPFSQDTMLSIFYYNCSAPRVDVPHGFHTRKLDCGNDNGRSSYFVSSALRSWDRAILENSSASCDRNVSIPVSRYALSIEDGNPTLEAIEKALKDGFEVMFTTECWECKQSQGSCGYNDSSRGFVCYCVDGPHKRKCPYIPTKSELTQSKKSELTKKQKLGIGFAGGFFGAILLAVAVLCIIWRRKRLAAQNISKGISTTSPYSSSNTMSNTPTSTTISGSNHSLMPSISNLANGSVYFGVQVFSYEELEEATANFSRELGDGGFGTVYYGILKDGRAVAVKRLFERSLRRVEQFKNEIDILRTLKHPNLVILYGCTTRHSRELLLVYEYISNGTLADHLHGDQAQSRPICWPARLSIAIQTAKALSFLHASGIIHRDVKTTNILLDSNYQVKVADFGLSRLFSTDQTHISTAPQGTPGYVDPEYYQCYRLNEKSDVYSFGVVLSELISSKEAVDTTRHRHDINLANMAISKIQNDAVHELADLTLGFARDPAVKRMMMSVAELAFRCLQQERDVRPSMDEIVEVLKGIQKEGMRDFPEVVDIDVSGGEDVVLLRHGVPPPLSPVTEKETSSSNTTSSSF
ncbi:LEAF RUST 10 DISEASE-RESISTANCE LOCUS RECEPTOR-LIKE PROTEIN KINASE-like 1.3 isoform X2 [Brassica rapa]|uniref:LEAF RUST 10 DISEASE-RESISTANCE LOCUS RECEPTOR-LIKE PROTEIN KINASE-like 1.3 isoform X2 n=1 Tax=Brassica campestris TaxID=3711 RepID=UPI0004F19FFA|nr:LEAF RUST 10 DISEASE-RESISTANCE LOCUS RECEPTOR-LIKE PROTEIN KINASE-like 1.3 isoform X2 [Brassica rapa]